MTVAPLSGYARMPVIYSPRDARFSIKNQHADKLYVKYNDEVLLHSPDSVIFHLISVAIGLY